jgi:branched-chain amino acid transport system substrate-binding protein
MSEQDNIRSFVSGYTQRFGKEPDWLAANAYDAIYLIANAYESGNFSANAIRTYLSSITNFSGIAGNLAFDEYGGVIREISILMVKNGSFVTLNHNEMEVF